MHYKNLQKHKSLSKDRQEKGFTLIELLVVVAIIGLLSAIVITSLSEARLKGRNSKRNQLALQYINALELYRENSSIGSYPNYGTSPFPMICIGRGDGESCHGPWPHAGDDNFDAELSIFLPGPPDNNDPIPSGAYDYSGTTYLCVELSGSVCENYNIRWYLEGVPDTVSCPRGSSKEEAGALSYCSFDSTGIN